MGRSPEHLVFLRLELSKSYSRLVGGNRGKFHLSIPAVGTCLSDALDTPRVERVQRQVHHGINSTAAFRTKYLGMTGKIPRAMETMISTELWMRGKGGTT